ncbi:hypothetical protein LOK49_Contig249G00001 [Camellia lanceoleosa]|nr:hypothetical protein LOK49_Contig249G00001 [Camellia lanceoleosa]
MAMSVCKSWPWNPLLLSPIQLCSLFYFVITLYYFPLHATAISFNFTNIDETLKNGDILVEGEIYFSNQGIQITPTNQVWKAGRASYKDPLYLWNKTSETLTDFNTYFSFVIDSQGNSSFGDGFAFFLLPYNFNSNIATGAAMGLPVKSIEPPQQTSFVAVEFDTYQNPDWDPQNITPGTHVGIDINSITSNVTKVWYNNIPSGIENEAWISYDSNSKNLSVVFTGYVNNGKIKSTLSFSVDLRDYLPEWVTIGFSAATGESYEKHTVKSWSFNSSFPAVTSSPRKKIKVALIVGLIVGSSALVGGLAFFGFVLWKKRREREEGEEFPFAHDMCMDEEFEAATLDIINIRAMINIINIGSIINISDINAMLNIVNISPDPHRSIINISGRHHQHGGWVRIIFAMADGSSPTSSSAPLCISDQGRIYLRSVGSPMILIGFSENMDATGVDVRFWRTLWSFDCRNLSLKMEIASPAEREHEGGEENNEIMFNQ